MKTLLKSLATACILTLLAGCSAEAGAPAQTKDSGPCAVFGMGLLPGQCIDAGGASYCCPAHACPSVPVVCQNSADGTCAEVCP